MDIATYDFEEAAARSRLSDWRLRRRFSAGTFEQTGFPTRLSHLGELRGLLVGMHRIERLTTYLLELGSFDDDDMSCVLNAVFRYVEWYRATFPDKSIFVPFGDLVSQYLAYTKLCGLPTRQRILEVGAGLGFSSTFIFDDEHVERYNAIEITQSLYVLQASLGRHLFGHRFCNHVMLPENPVTVGELDSWTTKTLNMQRIDLARSYRCHLYPWWRLDEPLRQEHDVIISHANLAEMYEGAAEYYASAWVKALAPGGYVLIQDTGNPMVGRASTVFNILEKVGFRALAKDGGPQAARPFFGWNLLLVHEKHPDYAIARPLSDPQVFLGDHPAVRSVYRMDRPERAAVGAARFAQNLRAEIGKAFG
ncbi:MAG: hypothetical protein P1U88_21005 [Thalassobaculaceae bacterium]|nr:hypothetical protein [Thalassobaculaceae bacterium]